MKRPVKTPRKHRAKRDLFVELMEGMDALADAPQGKRTLRTHSLELQPTPLSSMTKEIQAVYERGMIRPLEPLELPEGARVELIVVTHEQPKANRNASKILAEIAALPLEGSSDVESGCEFDSIRKNSNGSQGDKPMVRESSISPEVRDTLRALRRAARRALEIGLQTGTPVYVWKNGKIVDLTKERRPSKKSKPKRPSK